MNAKGLLAVPLLGFALAACSVTVTPTAPTITSVRTQNTFCSTTPPRSTVVDIKFSLGDTGLDHLTRLDIYFADAGATTIDEANTPHRSITTNITTVGGSRFATSYTLTPADLGQAGRVSPSAIIVTPANKQIFLRGWNNDVNGGFVKAINEIALSTDTASCDPSSDTVQ